MVSDGGSRGFLLIFFNSTVKYLVVAIIMSVAVEVGMMSLWGNKETICPMKMNWWQPSKFDDDNNVIDWGICTTQRGNVETRSRNLQYVHEEEL